MAKTKQKTVAKVWGPDIADRLARLAIDVGVRPPERMEAFETRVPARMIEQIRKVMEEAGIDWRALHRAEKDRLRDAAAQVHEENVRERAAE